MSIKYPVDIKLIIECGGVKDYSSKEPAALSHSVSPLRKVKLSMAPWVSSVRAGLLAWLSLFHHDKPECHTVSREAEFALILH